MSENHEGAERRLLLYVAGHTPKSANAVRVVRREWQSGPHGFEDVELVDVLANPQAAAAAGVAITPTLVAHTGAGQSRCVGRSVLDAEEVRRLIRTSAERAVTLESENSCMREAPLGESLLPPVTRRAPRQARPRYRLELYVNGSSSRSHDAEARVRDLCDVRWYGAYDLEVIDVLSSPVRARKASVATTPTLVVTGPSGIIRCVGHRSLDHDALATRLDEEREELDEEAYPRRVVIVEAGDHITYQLETWLRANKLPYSRYEDAESATETLLSMASGTLRAVLVVDLASVGEEGLRRLAAFAELRPGAYHVIALTAEPDAGEEMLCLQLGVAHYLRRDLPAAEIFAHIRPLIRFEIEADSHHPA